MGYMRHHAIVVTCWNLEHLVAARIKAVELFGPLVSDVVEYVVNGGGSFLIGPDGSKEGWTESDEHDRKRAEFKQWLHEASTYVEWAEVIVHEDDAPPSIVDAGSWRTTVEGIADV